MKTDRVRDLLRFMVKRAVASNLPLSAVTDGLKPNLHERAAEIYAALAEERKREERDA